MRPPAQRRRRSRAQAPERASCAIPPLRVEPSHDPRSARRQHLVHHLHAAGPRPVLEALLEVAAGQDLEAVLQRYQRIPVRIDLGLGTDVLPIDVITVIDGRRR
jgi:hypothetical protein